MTLLTATVTVYFNETHGSRFIAYRPDAEMAASRYWVARPIQLEVPSETAASCRTPGDVDRLIAERVFVLGNADDRPNGRYERSISMGDVIVIHGPSYLAPHRRFAVEMCGMRELAVPTDWPPRPAREAM